MDFAPLFGRRRTERKRPDRTEFPQIRGSPEGAHQNVRKQEADMEGPVTRMEQAQAAGYSLAVDTSERVETFVRGWDAGRPPRRAFSLMGRRWQRGGWLERLGMAFASLSG